MNPKISVIVPVYNTEKYVEKCIQSILSQSFHDLELILVNDGSTDSSGAICDKYSKKDNRVIVIHQENTGQGGARNTGIQKARGEYIGFVDSDDFIEKDMYLTMYSTLIHNKADIVCCQVKSINEDGKSILTEYNGSIKKDTESGREALIRYLKYGRWGPCDKLYKKSIIHKIEFLYNRSSGEDHAVMIPILFNSEKIVTIKNYFYNYLVREGSTTNSVFSIKSFDKIYVWEHVLQQSRNTDKFINKLVQAKLFMTYINLYNSFLLLNSNSINKELKEEFNSLKNKLKKIKISEIYNVNLKKRYMLGIILIKISPKIYNLILKFK